MYFGFVVWKNSQKSKLIVPPFVFCALWIFVYSCLALNVLNSKNVSNQVLWYITLSLIWDYFYFVKRSYKTALIFNLFCLLSSIYTASGLLNLLLFICSWISCLVNLLRCLESSLESLYFGYKQNF